MFAWRKYFVSATTVAMMLGGCRPAATDTSELAARRFVHPRAIGVTAPVPVEQVEDAAVWIHPTNPPASLLLVTNKAHGLEAHRPDGLLLKDYDDQAEYRGVDVVYDLVVGADQIDVAVVAVRSLEKEGIKIWQIDPQKSKLSDLTAGEVISVLDGQSPLGIAAYHSARSGKSFIFVSAESGDIEQGELVDVNGKLKLKKVRKFSRPGKVKGMVADNYAGVIYVAQEKAGVFAYPAEPEQTVDASEEIMRVGDHGLTGDLTGAALYCGSNGDGYLLIVSQSPRGTPSTIGVFDRKRPHRYLGMIAPSSDGFRAPCGASGITVTNRPTVQGLDSGFLAVKDRLNPNGVEDFKIYAWPDVAGPLGLRVNSDEDPRNQRTTVRKETR